MPGWHLSFRKQVGKSPKLHFVDTGVASYLLGIREPDQLRTHPLRGALFESWVASELLAHGVRQRSPDLAVETRVIYGGTTRQARGTTPVLPWQEIDQLTMPRGPAST